MFPTWIQKKAPGQLLSAPFWPLDWLKPFPSMRHLHLCPECVRASRTRSLEPSCTRTELRDVYYVERLIFVEQDLAARVPGVASASCLVDDPSADIERGV